MLFFGTVLITIGVTKWLTTASILKRQEIAAHAFLERAMQDENLAPGLVNSPRLLKAIYLATGNKEGVESCIIIVAAGLMTGAVGVFLVKRRGVQK